MSERITYERTLAFGLLIASLANVICLCGYL
jgi:hypothetical protein